MHPDCDVWWREVSEVGLSRATRRRWQDVIPPTPELAMPVWQAPRESSLVGLCFAMGHVGHIALEGPDLGACRLRNEARMVEKGCVWGCQVLYGGRFHVLQAASRVDSGEM